MRRYLKSKSVTSDVGSKTLLACLLAAFTLTPPGLSGCSTASTPSVQGAAVKSTDGEYVAEIANQALLGLLIKGDQVTAYSSGLNLADWQRFHAWFGGQLSNGGFALTQGGFRLEGAFAAEGQIKGKLTLPDGKSHDFTAQSARSGLSAGFYRLEEGGRRLGLIVSNERKSGGGLEAQGQTLRASLPGGVPRNGSRCLTVQAGAQNFLVGEAGGDGKPCVKPEANPSPSATASASATPLPGQSASASPATSPSVPSTPAPSSSVTGAPVIAAKGQLYVSNLESNAILRFSGVLEGGYTGDKIPDAVIKGNNTRIQQPGYLYHDAVNDRLYVPSKENDSLLIFDQVSSKTGNVTPDRIITSPDMDGPVHIAIDKQRDILYVSCLMSHSIVVYDKASSLSGQIKPNRILSGQGTNLYFPHGLAIDEAGDRLFVANTARHRIEIFEPASTIAGNASPSASLGGKNTLLNFPIYVSLSPKGDLIVSNTVDFARMTNVASPTNSVSTFAGAQGYSGNLAPIRTLSNQISAFEQPRQFAHHDNTLYLIDESAYRVYIYPVFDGLHGSRTPTRSIQGFLTELNRPFGLVLDPTR